MNADSWREYHGALCFKCRYVWMVGKVMVSIKTPSNLPILGSEENYKNHTFQGILT